MTIKNAESFFAWDVLSWLFVAMALAVTYQESGGSL